MEKQIISKLTKRFEDFRHEEDGVEFWYARELQGLLGYSKWENFSKIISKAQLSCDNAGNDPKDHFLDVRKMVEIGSGAERTIDDIYLTRYACYLIAQNGDPRKEEIAFAQSYFAIQTRKLELIEERLALQERFEAREKLTKSEKELSGIIFEKGVDSKGFTRIRSKGDSALFGGKNTSTMKDKLSVPKGRALADFLPTVTISAKNFATELTNYNVKSRDLSGESSISNEHVKNNKDVRDVMVRNDIYPEELPPEEDIKKLERKLKGSEKKLTSPRSKTKKPTKAQFNPLPA
ncbi:MAG TPA: DNA damage-inducible protein D [Caldisericia bacterium]|nr:DNA damage-inducible protein D [Caldisericia bacterium]HPF48729.1 DNA damage-inducible protein D [Caldisericia bacterium]HPI83611.1 DNA damage-inducible protein D [Caldisericia bacterium]HPQ93184.1 DNA damage-inducible protein D [Caldisericia bacterium]HRV74983.1 DNA damage-inducible protein D [Caldisericia bacterium]